MHGGMPGRGGSRHGQVTGEHHGLVVCVNVVPGIEEGADMGTLWAGKQLAVRVCMGTG